MPLSVARGRALPGDAWTPLDWALAQAWDELEQRTCDGCGTPFHEAFDPALENAWVADLPIRCHVCTARARQAEKYHDSEAPEALRFPVRKRAEQR